MKPWATLRTEEVVGSFEAAVGWSPALVPGQDLVSPRYDGIDDLAELGKFAGGVEIGEPAQRLESTVVVFGEIQAVEFLETFPGGP